MSEQENLPCIELQTLVGFMKLSFLSVGMAVRLQLVSIIVSVVHCSSLALPHTSSSGRQLLLPESAARLPKLPAKVTPRNTGLVGQRTELEKSPALRKITQQNLTNSACSSKFPISEQFQESGSGMSGE